MFAVQYFRVWGEVSAAGVLSMLDGNRSFLFVWLGDLCLFICCCLFCFVFVCLCFFG